MRWIPPTMLRETEACSFAFTTAASFAPCRSTKCTEVRLLEQILEIFTSSVQSFHHSSLSGLHVGKSVGSALTYLFIYLWLCWVFAAACSLSLVVVSGGYSSLQCTMQCIVVVSLGEEHGL